MKKLVLFALAALLVPSVALAKNGPPAGKNTGTQGKSAPKVLYILKGTITGYTAGTSVEIMVNHSNRHKWALNGATLTVPVSSATKIVLRHGATDVTVGDRGIVKVKAPKSLGSAADLESALPSLNAFQVIDQGVPGGKSSGTHGKSAPKVLYILKGTITGYTAGTSVEITVNHSNRHKWALNGMDLTVPLSSATKIVLRHGATDVTAGDRGIVKVKAPKSLSNATDLESALPSLNAFQVIDQGVAAP